MVQKIVVSHPRGGFIMDSDAEAWLSEHGFETRCPTCGHEIYLSDIPRNHPLLVQYVEECSPHELAIVEVPDGVEWEIAGDSEHRSEWVAGKHEKWFVPETDEATGHGGSAT